VKSEKNAKTGKTLLKMRLFPLCQSIVLSISLHYQKKLKKQKGEIRKAKIE
jgi:hypothetical protein